MSKALLKRLPLIVAALGALFLWQGGFGLWPVERTITFKLWGDMGSVREIDVQLYDVEELLEREVLSLPSGAMTEPSTKLSLKAGTYSARVMVTRADGGAPEVHTHELVLDNASTVFTVP